MLLYRGEKKRNGVSMRRRKRNEIEAAHLKILQWMVPLAAVMILTYNIFH